MKRIITLLLGLSGGALAVSVGLVTHMVFNQTLLFSTGASCAMLMILLQLHIMRRNGDLARQAEVDFQDLAQQIAHLEARVQSNDQRLQVTDVRVDQFQERMAQWVDQDARADIVEMGALISRMVDTIGALEQQAQLHRRLLLQPMHVPHAPQEPLSIGSDSQITLEPPVHHESTLHPSASGISGAPVHHARMTDMQQQRLPAEQVSELVSHRDQIKARALADMRQALNKHALIHSTKPLCFLAGGGVAARLHVNQLDLAGTASAHMSAEDRHQIASEHGLMPAIDLLALNTVCKQMLKDSSQDAHKMPEASLSVMPLSSALMTDKRFSDTFEQTLEAYRDISAHILLEFPAQLMSTRFTQTLPKDSALALRAKLTRFHRWGYRLGLRTQVEFGQDLGTGLPLSVLADCGFTHLRIPAKPLLAAHNAVRNGQKTSLDLHPNDYADLMTRKGLTLIADGVEDEFGILQLAQLGIQIGIGPALHDDHPPQSFLGAERAAE